MLRNSSVIFLVFLFLSTSNRLLTEAAPGKICDLTFDCYKLLVQSPACKTGHLAEDSHNYTLALRINDCHGEIFEENLMQWRLVYSNGHQETLNGCRGQLTCSIPRSKLEIGKNYKVEVTIWVGRIQDHVDLTFVLISKGGSSSSHGRVKARKGVGINGNFIGYVVKTDPKESNRSKFLSKKHLQRHRREPLPETRRSDYQHISKRNPPNDQIPEMRWQDNPYLKKLSSLHKEYKSGNLEPRESQGQQFEGENENKHWNRIDQFMSNHNLGTSAKGPQNSENYDSDDGAQHAKQGNDYADYDEGGDGNPDIGEINLQDSSDQVINENNIIEHQHQGLEHGNHDNVDQTRDDQFFEGENTAHENMLHDSMSQNKNGKHNAHRNGKQNDHLNGKHIDQENGKHIDHENGKHIDHENGKHIDQENGKHIAHENKKQIAHETVAHGDFGHYHVVEHVNKHKDHEEISQHHENGNNVYKKEQGKGLGHPNVKGSNSHKVPSYKHAGEHIIFTHHAQDGIGHKEGDEMESKTSNEATEEGKMEDEALLNLMYGFTTKKPDLNRSQEYIYKDLPSDHAGENHIFTHEETDSHHEDEHRIPVEKEIKPNLRVPVLDVFGEHNEENIKNKNATLIHGDTNKDTHENPSALPGNDSLHHDDHDAREHDAGEHEIPGHEGEHEIPGHEGKHEIPGHEGKHEIPGHAGEHEIPGHEGEHEIPGHEGKHEIPGHAGEHEIPGHEGEHEIPSNAGEHGIPGHEGEHPIQGHEGEHQIQGHTGEHEIPGHEGEHEIPGHGGEHEIPGHEGEHEILGHGGEHQIQGHAGEHEIPGHAGEHEIPGHGGEHEIPSHGGEHEIPGHEGEHEIPGHGGEHEIPGHEGEHEIPGHGGEHEIPGHGGEHEIPGHEAKHEIPGHEEEHEIPGHGGEHEIPGHEEEHEIPGHGGEHEIPGHGGEHEIPGHAGEQPIQGHEGDHQIQGHTGEHEIPGHEGEHEIPGYGGEHEIPGHEREHEIPGHGGEHEIPGHEGEHEIPGHGGEHEIPGHEGKHEIPGHEEEHEIPGHGGEHEIPGHGGEHEIPGHAGEQLIQGHAGEHEISGHEGEHEIPGHEGEYEISGHEGEHEIPGHEGVNEIPGHEGEHEIPGHEGEHGIPGHEGEHQIQGHEGEHEIQGHEGEHEIPGHEGEHDIPGHEGEHQIQGHAGEHEIPGHEGEHQIQGHAGEHEIPGHEGEHQIQGHAGEHEIPGHEGEHQIQGHAGEHEIPGHEGEHEIPGHEGEHEIQGHAGEHEIPGHAGEHEIPGHEGEHEIPSNAREHGIPGHEGEHPIQGHEGEHQIQGHTGEHEIPGHEGEHEIPGHGGKHEIPGHEGEHEILGHGGEHQIQGHAGEHEIPGHAGEHEIPGHGGQHEIPGHGGEHEIPGHEGEHEIPGHGGEHEIPGHEGEHQIQGHAGEHEIPGHAGEHEIPGHAGEHEIPGHEGEHPIQGHAGEHEIPGHEGEHEIPGHGGEHEIPGHGGEHEIPGHEGEHEIPGHEGEHEIPGHEGEHEIQGHAGEHEIPGNEGEHEIPGHEGDHEIPGHEGDHEIPSHAGEQKLPSHEGEQQIPSQEGEQANIIDYGEVDVPDLGGMHEVPSYDRENRLFSNQREEGWIPINKVVRGPRPRFSGKTNYAYEYPVRDQLYPQDEYLTQGEADPGYEEQFVHAVPHYRNEFNNPSRVGMYPHHGTPLQRNEYEYDYPSNEKMRSNKQGTYQNEHGKIELYLQNPELLNNSNEYIEILRHDIIQLLSFLNLSASDMKDLEKLTRDKATFIAMNSKEAKSAAEQTGLALGELMKKFYGISYNASRAAIQKGLNMINDHLKKISAWGPWAKWTSCPKSCTGQTFRMRERKCMGSDQCIGRATMFAPCPSDCKAYSKWSEWNPWGACTRTCGVGVQIRTRMCKMVGSMCKGQNSEIRGCNNTACPTPTKHAKVALNLKPLEWGHWSSCSVTCGVGTRFRQQLCPQHVHQSSCEGNFETEKDRCTKPACRSEVEQQQVQILQGADVVLQCGKTSNHDSAVWVIPNGKKLDKHSFYKRFSVVEGKLLIRETQRQDHGVYHCITTDKFTADVELDVLWCGQDLCQHGGECIMVPGDLIPYVERSKCSCTAGYTGMFCEKVKPWPVKVVGLVLVSLIVVGILTCIVVTYLCQRKRHMKALSENVSKLPTKEELDRTQDSERAEELNNSIISNDNTVTEIDEAAYKDFKQANSFTMYKAGKKSSKTKVNGTKTKVHGTRSKTRSKTSVEELTIDIQERRIQPQVDFTSYPDTEYYSAGKHGYPFNTIPANVIYDPADEHLYENYVPQSQSRSSNTSLSGKKMSTKNSAVRGSDFAVSVGDEQVNQKGNRSVPTMESQSQKAARLSESYNQHQQEVPAKKKKSSLMHFLEKFSPRHLIVHNSPKPSKPTVIPDGHPQLQDTMHGYAPWQGEYVRSDEPQGIQEIYPQPQDTVPQYVPYQRDRPSSRSQELLIIQNEYPQQQDTGHQNVPWQSNSYPLSQGYVNEQQHNPGYDFQESAEFSSYAQSEWEKTGKKDVANVSRRLNFEGEIEEVHDFSKSHDYNAQMMSRPQEPKQRVDDYRPSPPALHDFSKSHDYNAQMMSRPQEPKQRVDEYRPSPPASDQKKKNKEVIMVHRSTIRRSKNSKGSPQQGQVTTPQKNQRLTPQLTGSPQLGHDEVTTPQRGQRAVIVSGQSPKPEPQCNPGYLDNSPQRSVEMQDSTRNAKGESSGSQVDISYNPEYRETRSLRVMQHNPEYTEARSLRVMEHKSEFTEARSLEAMHQVRATYFTSTPKKDEIDLDSDDSYGDGDDEIEDGGYPYKKGYAMTNIPGGKLQGEDIENAFQCIISPMTQREMADINIDNQTEPQAGEEEDSYVNNQQGPLLSPISEEGTGLTSKDSSKKSTTDLKVPRLILQDDSETSTTSSARSEGLNSTIIYEESQNITNETSNYETASHTSHSSFEDSDHGKYTEEE